ncbi:MAG: hypothetical protein K9L57_06235 [Spirochaetaceae bacterium]|nr:hypothetical protein [Spirochaetia bacterium]MCF7951212.1 hypothetical protein [Spirochaetaceae bacterium]
MEKRPTPTPADLLRSLLSQNSYSLRELDHFYRLLSKRCHPDATGGTGEEFIELRQVYEQETARLLVGAQAAAPQPQHQSSDQSQHQSSDQPQANQQGSEQHETPEPEPFDPRQLVREAGFDLRLPPRGCLYVGLQAFFSSGMYNYRIRAMHGLKRRNTTILRTIFHWSRLYDPDFAALFSAYSRHPLQSLSTTQQIKNFSYAKRLFLDGITGFFNYQHSGRSGTAAVSRDKFAWCSYTIRRVIKIDHPMAALAEWFSAEVDKPPQFRGYE